MSIRPRILLYGHDTIGLGHIRRNAKLAHAFAEAFKDARIVIASGSYEAVSFARSSRVEIASLPAIRKNSDGTYRSADPSQSLAQTTNMRRQKLQNLAENFSPHILVTDKEARGLNGELEGALDVVAHGGGTAVLGLRDILDDTETVRREWAERDTLAAIQRWYREIWIYGPRWFYDPLEGLDLTNLNIARHHVGFICSKSILPFKREPNHVLVTTGGGGDGTQLLRSTCAAIETGSLDDCKFVLMPGPQIDPEVRKQIIAWAAGRDRVTIADFMPDTEALFRRAKAVIAMCGYNTFCELMHFDIPTLFVPREKPRQEQLIRASRAAALGLAQCLRLEEARDPVRMAAAIAKLLQAPKPSQSGQVLPFDGLNNAVGRLQCLLDKAGSRAIPT